MKKTFLVSFLLFYSLFLFSQTSWHIGTYSPDGESEYANLGSKHAPFKLVYKIPNELLYGFLDEEKVMEFVKNTIPFDTLDYDARLDSVLPEGNYIVESAENDRVNYSYEFVSNFKVRVYQYKGKHYVMMVMDSMNHILPNTKVFYEGKKEIKYNAEIKGFIIKSNGDYENYLIQVGDQMILLEFDGGKSVYDFNDYRNRNNKNGYLVTDKPIYRIGDTLHFKAYIFNKKGNLVNKTLRMRLQGQYGYDNHKHIDKEINPSSPGVFMGNFVISDTFELDKNYTLSVGNDLYRRGVEVAQSFSIEDYQLDKYRLHASLDKKELFNKGTVELNIQARDFNNYLIKNGRYEITITANSINFYDSINHFVPNTIIKKAGRLLSNEPTKFKINASDLLNADATYNIELKTWNSANEIHSSNFSFDNSVSPQLKISYNMDTVHYMVHNNDGWVLSMEYEDEYDYEIITKKVAQDSGSIIVDFSAYLPTFILTKGAKTKKQDLERHVWQPYIRFYRKGNQLYISNTNSRNIHIKLQVYDGKKLIYQKAAALLDTILTTSEKNDLFVHTSYYWGGEPESEEYKLSPNLNEYNVEIQIADTIYPGEESTLKVKVTDYNGKAVKGANITAYAVNSEFAYDIPYINFSSNEIRENRNDNSWDFDLDYPIYFSKRFKNKFKNKFKISESQLNYQMRFPEDGLFINDYPGANGFVHFSPYLLSHGSIQNIYYILIDNVPVYLANDKSRAWSFNYVPGVHTIKIRSIDKLYTIPNIYLKDSRKTDIFLDINHIPDSIMVTNKSNKLTKSETKMFQHYTKQFSFPYRRTGPAFLQANTLFYSQRNGSIYSPFYNENFLYLHDDLIAFKATSDYNTYSVKNGIIYTSNKEIKIQRKLKKYYFHHNNNQEQIGRFSSRIFANTKPVIEKPIILPFMEMNKSNCSIDIELNNDSISQNDIYLCNLDSGTIIKYRNNAYRTYESSFSFKDANSGSYQIIAFTKNNNILIYKALLKPNGLNLINLNNNYSKYISFNNLSRDKKDDIIWNLFYGSKIKLDKNRNFTKVQHISSTKNNTTNIPIYLIDKLNRSFLQAPVFYYNADTLRAKIKTGLFSYTIPKQDSSFTIIVDILAYKTIKFTINPKKSKTDYILIYLEAETNKVSVYTKKYGYVNTYAGDYLPYKYNARRAKKYGHATVRFLGGDEAYMDYDSPMIVSENKSNGQIRGVIRLVRITGNANRTINCPSFGYYEEEVNQLDSITRGIPAMYGDISPILEFIARSNFNDVGFWVPNLVTDENGEAEVKVKFPDNITSWTAQVIAAGDKKKAGVAYKTIIATKNQLARIETPRFLTQGDSCLINTKLVNYDNKPLLLKDYFKLNDKLQTSKKFKLDSFITQQQLIIADTANQIVEYGFTAKGGIQDAEQRIINVVPQGSWHSEGEFFVLEGDTSITINAQDKDVKLVVYKDLLEVMLNDIEKIKTYKYDCNEQKASKLIALLLQEQIDNYLGIKIKDKRKIKRLIKSLEKASNYPLNWGWWPETKSIGWISNHIVYALMMAENHNYQTILAYQYIGLEDSRSDNAQMRYMRSQIVDWKQNPVSINWNREFKSVEDQLWNLKAKMAYNMNVSVKDILVLSHSTLKGGLYWGENDYSRTENKILCTSLAFELIREIDSTNIALDKTLLFLLAHHGFDRMNTYETAYMANAIIPYLLAPNSELTTSTISDKSGKELVFDQKIVIKAGESFILNKKGNSKVFAMQYSQYFDAQPKLVDSLFKVQIQYFIDDSLVTSFTAGDQVIMKLNVIAKKQADYAMIEIPLPASCTYSNANNIENAHEVHREKYKEKLIIYCELLPEGKSTFQVELQARFPGTFNVNPTNVKEMYYPFFFGRNGMKRVRVEKR